MHWKHTRTMANSATGGYLQPTNPPPLEGAALEDFFHDILVGWSGLANELVRPAYQPEPPNLPEKSAGAWIGFYFIDKYSDPMPFVGQVQEGDAVQQSQLQQHEEFDVHCSIYGVGAGSQARAVAKLIRANASVPQNQEALYSQGMALIEIMPPQPAPVLTKTIWLYRVDMDIRIRRIIVRDYAVETIQGAEIDLIAQTGQVTEIDVPIQVQPEE